MVERIGEFTTVSPSATVGRNCVIGSHCSIADGVVIGDRVTVMEGVHLAANLRIGDDVVIGPRVTFAQTAESFGKATGQPETHIDLGAHLGGGATILTGLKIGRNAVIEPGAVVGRSVPPNAIVAGNPATIVGYVTASVSTSPSIPSPAPGTADSRVAHLVQLPRVTDIRGSLSVGEFERTVPFPTKRYFTVFDVPSRETRGEHAHRECHQFLVCVRGSLSVVADDGVNREEYRLDRPELGLHLPPMVWGIQYRYSHDAVLLVFASHYYDAADYIRDYDEFLSLVGSAK